MPGGLIAILGGLFVVGGVSYFSSLDLLMGYKVFYFLLTAVLTAATCKLAIFSIRNRKKKELYLEDSQEGFVASTFNETVLGGIAVAASDLKPSGHIEINGNCHQAISEGQYIFKGSPVTILNGRGAYLIVKEKK